MDEKLLNRLQALGSILVCVAYFLPWASIMSPLGSIEVRGLFIDYAWVILILAILHLLVQFARLNKSALGLPDEFSKGADIIWLSVPFIFVAFFAWYGAGFIFRDAASGARATFFGVTVESTVRAGLDYGFWIGALGALFAIAGVGLISQRIKTVASYGVVVVVAVSVLAFALSMAGKGTQSASTTQAALASAPIPSPAAPDTPPEPTLDASPYVVVTKITATQLPKDLDANRFNDSIIISPVFKNVGTKTIVGIQGHISVLDGFGKEVYGFNFRDDDKITPGAESDSGYNFDGNQFEDDDPYHKMLPLISGGTAKYNSKILHIAFDDGTVLPK
jgi:hypothetical protein